jgi:hypothetical protein
MTTADDRETDVSRFTYRHTLYCMQSEHTAHYQYTVLPYWRVAALLLFYYIDK